MEPWWDRFASLLAAELARRWCQHRGQTNQEPNAERPPCKEESARDPDAAQDLTSDADERR